MFKPAYPYYKRIVQGFLSLFAISLVSAVLQQFPRSLATLKFVSMVRDHWSMFTRPLAVAIAISISWHNLSCRLYARCQLNLSSLVNRAGWAELLIQHLSDARPTWALVTINLFIQAVPFSISIWKPCVALNSWKRLDVAQTCCCTCDERTPHVATGGG